MGAHGRVHKVDFVAAPWPIAIMLAAIPFPDISPDLFSIDIGSFTLALRWYALAYIVGIIIGWRLAVRLVRNAGIWADGAPMDTKQVEDLLTWIILGIILGGRLGYVLFYDPGHYLENPGQIPAVWNGGMSFHGGFLGVIVAVYVFSRRHNLKIGNIADILAICTPPGLLLGRVANFVNAELWGRPTDVPWGVIFPGQAAQDCAGIAIGACARHPSQLYEAVLEGLLLGGVLLFLAFRRGWLKTPWMLTALFFAGYGCARFIVEFFRQADDLFINADNPLGHVVGTASFGITMGQVLSLPMILIGVALFLWARRRA